MQLGELRRRGGEPLPEDTRRFMESRFGHSFGDVRVHAGGTAAELAKGVRAKAFTVGSDVVFGRGEYRPHTSAGQRLLAHELVHTLQQVPGVLQRGCPEPYKETPNWVKNTRVGEVRIVESRGTVIARVRSASSGEPVCVLAYRGLAAYYGVSVAEIDAAVEAAVEVENPGDPKLDLERPSEDTQGWMAFELRSDIRRSLEDYGLAPVGTPQHVANEIRDLPPAVKDFLFDEEATETLEITAQNYKVLEEIAELASSMSPEEREEFLLRARAQGGRSTNWTRFRNSLRAFVEEQQARGVNLLELTQLRTRLSKISPTTADMAIAAMYDPSPAEWSRAPLYVQAHGALQAEGFPGGTDEVGTLVERLTATIAAEAAQIALSHLARYETNLRQIATYYEFDENVASLHTQMQGAYHDPAASARFGESYTLTSYTRHDIMQRQKARSAFLRSETRREVASDHPIVAERGFELDDLVYRTTTTEDVGKYVETFVAERLRDVDRARAVLGDESKRRIVLIRGEMDELLAATFQALGMPPSDAARRLVEGFIASEAFQASITAVLEVVAEIVIATIATAMGGPIGMMVTAGLAAKGVADTAEELEKLRTGRAAYRTGLASTEPTALWVALQVASLGLDVAGLSARVLQTLRAFDTGSIRTVGELSDELDALRAQGLSSEKIDELLAAAKTRSAAKSAEALDVAAQTSKKTAVTIAGEPHSVFAWIDPRTGRYVLGLCSDECGQLARKIELNLARMPKDATEARAILEKYKRLAEATQAKTADDAQNKAAELVAQLDSELEAKGLKGAFDPDIGEDVAGVRAVTEVRSEPQRGAVPYVLRSTGGQTIRLDGNWKATRFASGDDSLVYILRDAETGELLKVGKSEVSTFTGRFQPYERAGRRTGRKIEAEIYTFQSEGFSPQAVEEQIRSTLAGQGHRLPWDNTGGRLGREGPGTPGAPIPRRLRDKLKWDYNTETLVPR